MLIRLEILLLASSWIGDSSSGLSECVHGKWLVLELCFNNRARTSSSSILSAQLREAYVPVVECSVPRLVSRRALCISAECLPGHCSV